MQKLTHKCRNGKKKKEVKTLVKAGNNATAKFCFHLVESFTFIPSWYFSFRHLAVMMFLSELSDYY
jgi:hypothetical protein